VHGGRCSRCRFVVRAAVPVLRNADRFSNSAAQDPAGDYPGYRASRDDRPDCIPVADRIAYGVPDRFAVRFCDGISVTAFQLVSFVGARLAFVSLCGG